MSSMNTLIYLLYMVPHRPHRTEGDHPVYVEHGKEDRLILAKSPAHRYFRPVR